MPYKNSEQQRAAQLKHYLANKEAYISRARDRRSLVRKYVLSYKIDNPTCQECLFDYPSWILEFDHLPDREAKVKNIAQMARDCSLDTIKIEIAKCELVCANCHANRTYMRSVNINPTTKGVIV